MNGQTLLALQQIDSALDQIVNRRARLPELAARSSAADAVAVLRAAAADADQRAAEAQAAIDASEHASEELTKKRTRLEGQLKTIIAPREAEALMHEIATINERRSELDDQELAALEAQAEAEAQSADIAGRVPHADELLRIAQEALAVAQAELSAQEREQRLARESVVSSLDERDLEVYERARRQFDGVAVATLDGSRCTGCHLDISRGEIDAIRALPPGDLAECPQCGRFLVR